MLGALAGGSVQGAQARVEVASNPSETVIWIGFTGGGTGAGLGLGLGSGLPWGPPGITLGVGTGLGAGGKYAWLGMK
jgi:hypothetical protein